MIRCSQRKSLPAMPINLTCGSPGLVVGPVDAFRGGNPGIGTVNRTGPAMPPSQSTTLGGVLGVELIKSWTSDFNLGNSPRCAMKIRFGFCAKIACTAPQVQFS